MVEALWPQTTTSMKILPSRLNLFRSVAPNHHVREEPTIQTESVQEVQPGPRRARLAAVAVATESLLYSPSVEQLQETPLVGITRRTLARRKTPAGLVTELTEQKLQIFTVILFVLQIDAILRKEAMKAMTETFYAAIFGYDEGILSDDCVLAAALWRNLLNRQCEDPQQLELMVEYVRKQATPQTLCYLV
ncbi:hypothetical protein ATANTOWER_020962 [Ataeniobius toweri]|uniref:Ubiquinol-cytochrome c chaperone domain-containing protein n=1 Tax=Ataeniobius toweri TaxID=208326 RepID=A0ABU7BJU4_9TELE|nr:hypothetical protein [Ataeniobius toweri]